MQQPLGRIVVLILLGWLAATQGAEIRLIGDGLSPSSDPYSEADALRSAEHYARFGFTADAGLPNILYGRRFPRDGVAAGADFLFDGVYTRYPPLPNLLCGLFEVTIGYRHLWAWRLLPVAVTLAATALLFLALEATFGSVLAAAITVLASAAPMTTSYMHGLHFQGYAHALLLVQIALLVPILFDRESAASRVVLVGLVAFVQGWLSFEYIFIVAGAAMPLALVARQYGYRASGRVVRLVTAVAGGGFLAANILHFIQVIVFHGSVAAAYADFRGRAVERMGGHESLPYLLEMPLVVGRYLKALWIGPGMIHFGILLPAVTFGLIVAAVRRRASRDDVRALLAAYGVSLMWVMFMPQHANDHTHFVPRIFFLAYFTAILACALRLRAWLAARSAATSAGRSPQSGI